MSALGAIACGLGVVCLAFALAYPRGMPAPVRGSAHVFARFRATIEQRRADAEAGARARELLHATHAGLRAGLPLAAALRIALHDAERVMNSSFGRALRSFDLGTPLDTGLREAAARSSDRRVTLACDALALVAAEQLAATRSAGIVASVTDRLAFEERLLDETRARSAGARTQVLLLAALVPAIALYLAITLPGLAATLATPLGTHVLIPAAAVFEAVGILASRRIVSDLAS